jgi:hypothetical protein
MGGHGFVASAEGICRMEPVGCIQGDSATHPFATVDRASVPIDSSSLS